MTAYCSAGDHYPAEVIVFVPDDLDPDGIGILIEGASGKSTNRWADGIVGVSAEAQELAEDEDDATCIEHHADIEWRT